MHSAWLRNTFLRFLKFLQIKEGDLIFWGTNSAESLNYLVSPFCINFKSFKDPNSSSSIRFQCILLEWRVPFSDFWKLPQIKEVDLISWGWGVWGTNSAERLNYLVPLLYLNFKSFKDPKSFLFFRFQCILHNYGILSNTFQISTN